MSNVHPKVSYEVNKLKVMMETIDNLLKINSLEICSKLTFNRTDENGVEYITTGYCTMPLYHSHGFNGHFEFRITQELYDPDEMTYEIRFYANSMDENCNVKLFKAIYDPLKYEDSKLENELYSLYKKIEKEYNRVDDALNELKMFMANIYELNEKQEGYLFDKLNGCCNDNKKPDKEYQNGGPKPPYKPAYQYLSKHEQYHEWLKQNFDCDCHDE